MGRPLAQTLPNLLREKMAEILSEQNLASLPATVRIFLPSIIKFLPQLTENQANKVANEILKFAADVWDLQKESQAIEAIKIEEKTIASLPPART
jgi:hypothetical protein